MTYEEHQLRLGRRKATLEADLAAALSGQRRITLEIGSGHGHWLMDYAKVFPDKFCLGIDISNSRLRRARRKLESLPRPNLAFVQGEALEVLESLDPLIRIEEAFILFPDPWPKKKHWKNRLINKAFLTKLGAFCPLDTRIYFRTDVEDYYSWTETAVEAHLDWQTIKLDSWPVGRPTVFEQKAESYQSLVFVKA